MKIELISKYPNDARRKSPILFVHGAWAGAWCWNVHFMDYFAKHGFQCHALSLRGHGSSNGIGSVKTAAIADYLEDVRKTAKGLDAPPVLVGHSMGGFITQHYLAEYGAPAGVLIASVPPTGITPLVWRMGFGSPFLLWTMKLMTIWPKPMWKYFMGEDDVKRLFFNRSMPHRDIRKFSKLFQNESLRAILDMTGFNLPRSWKVKSHVMVVGGKEDPIIPPKTLFQTAETYHTEPFILPDLGHSMMLDANWKSVADTVIDWLTENDL